jgi:anti-sigma-K factor RskA
MTHEEANGLLAAFALDALDQDERDQVQEHLETCRRCRAEVGAHHEVVGALGNSVAPLPGDLWEIVASRLTTPDLNPENADARLLARVRLSPGERITPRDRWSRTERCPSVRFVTAASFAVGAAAVATVLGMGLANANDQIAHIEGAIGETAHTEAIAAMETPGHKIVNLADARHHDVAQFVVLPNGRGYLVMSSLSALPSTETYQLWRVMHGKTISLGLLGRAPRLATFTSAGSDRPYRLGVTVEPSDGALRPSGSMLASGTA